MPKYGILVKNYDNGYSLYLIKDHLNEIARTVKGKLTSRVAMGLNYDKLEDALNAQDSDFYTQHLTFLFEDFTDLNEIKVIKGLVEKVMKDKGITLDEEQLKALDSKVN